MAHVVLLGDSILDNASYVPDEASVIVQIRRSLPASSRATLLAVDGSTTVHVPEQLAAIPADATHIVLSIGGNNAIPHSGLVHEAQAVSYAQVLSKMAEIREEFAAQYRPLVAALSGLSRPSAVCTIYDAIPGLTAEASAALCVFNDVIVREAFRSGLSVIDLRLICDDASDYAAVSPIEPSAKGGEKIAGAILRWVNGVTQPGRVVM